MPEVQDKSHNVNTNVGLGAKAKAKKKLAALFRTKKESTTSSSDEQGFVDVKSLSHSHHVELRKSALTFYLNSLCDILYGAEAVENPISIVQTVYAIYTTLHNSFVYFNWHETDWKFQEITEVNFTF